MLHNDIISSWRTRTGVIATMHGKEAIIGPLLFEAFEMRTVVPLDFNTDQFGTFTRDIPRAGNQREAARKKALAAIAHTNHTVAIASEGSFGTRPDLPLLQQNLELVLLIDTQYQLEIIGVHRSHRPMFRQKVLKTADEVVATALAWGFPTQGVILRRHSTDTKHLYKEINSIDELRLRASALLQGWLPQSVILETDLRAHRCPSRQQHIAAATKDLISACRQCCPSCGMPGFICTETIPGLPCKQCGRPTALAYRHIYTCAHCKFRNEVAASTVTEADPSDCQWCNP
jgi:hypothetical protein